MRKVTVEYAPRQQMNSIFTPGEQYELLSYGSPANDFRLVMVSDQGTISSGHADDFLVAYIDGEETAWFKAKKKAEAERKRQETLAKKKADKEQKQAEADPEKDADQG